MTEPGIWPDDAEEGATPSIRQRFYPLVWQLVAAIPPGSIATYGQIAAMAGFPRYGRWVGRALAALPEGSRLPWFRVMNAQGRISFAPGSAEALAQQQNLAAEGVIPDGDRYSLRRYRWQP